MLLLKRRYRWVAHLLTLAMNPGWPILCVVCKAWAFPNAEAWALAVDFILPGTVSALTVEKRQRALNVITAWTIRITLHAVAITGSLGWARRSAVTCSRKFWKRLGSAMNSLWWVMW